jgi:hypothetical protein
MTITSLPIKDNRLSGAYLMWLVPLLLVTFWLGARGLNADPLWGDERLSILDAGGGPYEPRTLAQIWEGVTARNPWHAPGFFMVLSSWGRVVGWQPPALRAMSLLFGVLAVAFTYRLGRDMVSPRAGLYAAAVVGTSAFFVHYLHELRMYSLFALLTPFTVWVYWRIVTAKREPGKLLWLGLLAGAIAMLYTHYFASLPLFAIGLYHLLFVKKTRRWWQVVGVMALAGLCFMPWFSSLIAGLGRASSEEAGYVRSGAATPQETIERLVYLFSNGSLITLGIAGVLSLLARGRGVWQIWFFMLSVLALILLVNAEFRVMTITRMRYLLGLWPLLALVIALGIIWLERWRWAAPLALGIWLVIGIGTSVNRNFINAGIVDGKGYMFPWHIAQPVFMSYTQPGDTLVLNVPDDAGSVASRNQTIATYYLSGSQVGITVMERMQSDAEQEAVQDSAVDFAKQSLRVWVGYEADRQLRALPDFEAKLGAEYVPCETGIAQSSFRFDLYARSEVCCLPRADATPVLHFGEGITLTGLAPLPDEASGTLPVIAGWSVADDVPAYVYSVALHVLDEDGQLVAQGDYGLPETRFSCQETPIDISGLQPGNYDLYGLIYAWESGQRLTGEAVATGETGDRLLLGTFEVTE